jgi:hypothetical protein
VPDAQSPATVDATSTGKGECRVPCAGCGKPVRASNKSGRCNPCYRKIEGDYLRDRASRNGERRKREPEDQFAMLLRMVKSTAKRAMGEDPGRGLAGFLHFEDAVRALVREVGADLVEQVGPSRVGEDLGWTRDRVYHRFVTRTRKGGE